MESKNNTNESVYNIEIDSDAQKTNLQLPKGIGREGRTNQKYRINRHTAINVSNRKQQGITVKHREFYSVSCNNL